MHVLAAARGPVQGRRAQESGAAAAPRAAAALAAAACAIWWQAGSELADKDRAGRGSGRLLGASAGNILQLVLRAGAIQVGTGLALGFVVLDVHIG